MTALTYDEFRQNALAQGCTEVLVREWAPDTVVPEHSHPFSADALLINGELWLTVGAQERHLVPGDTFQLDANVRHSERYGPDGAVFWVGRRLAVSAVAP